MMESDFPFMCSDEELLLRNEKWENMLKKYNHSLYHDDAATEMTVTEWVSRSMCDSEPNNRPEVLHSMTTRSRCGSRLMEEGEPESSPRREKSRGENQSSSLERVEEGVDEESDVDEVKDEENLSRREVTTDFQRKGASPRREKWIEESKEIILEDEDDLQRKGEEKEIERDENPKRRDKSRGNAFRDTNGTVDKETSDKMEECREKERMEEEREMEESEEKNVADGAEESLTQANWIYNNNCDKQPVLLASKLSRVRVWLMSSPGPESCSEIPSRVRGLDQHPDTDSQSSCSDLVSGSLPGTVSVASPEPVRPLSQEPVGAASRELLSASSLEPVTAMSTELLSASSLEPVTAMSTKQPANDGSSQASTVLASATCSEVFFPSAQPALQSPPARRNTEPVSTSRLASKLSPQDQGDTRPDRVSRDICMVFQSTDDISDLSCRPIDLSCRPKNISCRPDNLSGRPRDLNYPPDDFSWQPIDFSGRQSPVLLEPVDKYMNACEGMSDNRAREKHSATEMEKAEDLTVNVQRNDRLWSARVADCQIVKAVRSDAECYERLPSEKVGDCQVGKAVRLDDECDERVISEMVVDCPLVETSQLDAECDERHTSVTVEDCRVVDASLLHAGKVTSERSKFRRTLRNSNTPLWIARIMQARKRDRVTDKSRGSRKTNYDTVRAASSACVASTPSLDEHSVKSGGDVVNSVVEEGTLLESSQRRRPEKDLRKNNSEVLLMPSDAVLESCVARQQGTSRPTRDSSHDRKRDCAAARKEANVSKKLLRKVNMESSSIVALEMKIVTNFDEEILLSNAGRRKKSSTKKSVEKEKFWTDTKGKCSADTKGKDSTDKPSKEKDSTPRPSKGKDSIADLEQTPLTSHRGTRLGERKIASELKVQSNADKKWFPYLRTIVLGTETSRSDCSDGRNATAAEVSRSQAGRLDHTSPDLISTGAGKLEDSWDSSGPIQRTPVAVAATVPGLCVPRRRSAESSALETRGRKTGDVTPAKVKRPSGLRSSDSHSSPEESNSVTTGNRETSVTWDFNKASIGLKKAATPRSAVKVKTGWSKSSTTSPSIVLEIASDSDEEWTSLTLRRSRYRRSTVSRTSSVKRDCKSYDDHVNGDGRVMKPRERRSELRAVVSTRSVRTTERITRSKVERRNESTSPLRGSSKKNGRWEADGETEAPTYHARGAAGKRKTCRRLVRPDGDVDRVDRLPGGDVDKVARSLSGGMIFMSDADHTSEIFDRS